MNLKQIVALATQAGRVRADGKYDDATGRLQLIVMAMYEALTPEQKAVVAENLQTWSQP